jgi:hypothetical protein
MMPGDQVTLNVSFEPQEMGMHEARFIMVCDNCQVRKTRREEMGRAQV